MATLFNKDYVDYWKKKAGELADEEVISFHIDQLGINEKDVVLDLGCGHGRLFPIISKYSNNVIGIDINFETINTAVKFPYLCLVKGSAEETNTPSGFFDKVIAWAVFDAVDQEKALIEQNRILKDGGYLLITGKNHNYKSNDNRAFIAERNARLKKFPNHFTNVEKLIKISNKFGFYVKKGYGFPMRGDGGRMVYFDLLNDKTKYYYEYILILEKKGVSVNHNEKICDSYSTTVKKMAEDNGFGDIDKFFNWHKAKYGDG